MTAPQGPTSLTLSGIVDGQNIDASDVTVPFGEVEDAIDEARTTARCKSTDTVLQYIADMLIAGSGVSLTQITALGATTITIASIAPPTGATFPFFGSSSNVPVGYLLCNGQAVSMTSYKTLLDYLIEGVADNGAGSVLTTYGATSATAFTADAATDKILAAGHGLSDGDVVMVANSGGALPGGLAANTAYYVVSAALNDFKVSLTDGGTAVDITDAGTGTQSFYSTFCVPDLRGRGFVGLDNMGGSSANRITATEADAIGGAYGAETHTLTAAEIPAHTHDIKLYTDSGGSLMDGGMNSTTHASTSTTEANPGGGGAHNNVQPSQFGNWIIKV